MQVGTRKLGWFKQQSAWETMQVRRERSAIHRKKFEEQRTATFDRLNNVAANQSFGLGELAAQAALKRIREEAVVRFQERQREADAQATRELIWRNKEMPAQVEAGGATVDLVGGRLTLADGTRLDLATGRPVEGNSMTLADGTKLNLDTGNVTGGVNIKA